MDLDFSDAAVFDNHSHPIDPETKTMLPELMAREFHHGFGDIVGGNRGMVGGYSDRLNKSVSSMGVVQTLVHMLSELLNCPADLRSVTFARDDRSEGDYRGYISMLYWDAKIAGCVMDTGLKSNDPALELMPCSIYRLFQFDTVFTQLLQRKIPTRH